MDYLELNNKYKIGFGTWKLPNNEETISIMKDAVEVGYRHIDTASSYGNEIYVGKGIKTSGVERKDFFITGKLWNSDKGYENIIKACKKTIENLDCEYLDLYLVHWPASPAVHENSEEMNDETWKAFEYLYDEGFVKSIGVSNFKKSQLEKLIKKCNVKPVVNQIEFHPGFMQKETFDYCKRNNIQVCAWSPLGSGKMLKKEELINIANKYNTTPAVICIKWCLQNGVIPICKSANKDRMKQNFDLPEFEISVSDMEYLNGLKNIGGGSGLDSETITIFG